MAGDLVNLNNGPAYGLLGGIGAGLSSFADSYMAAKKMKNEQAYQQGLIDAKNREIDLETQKQGITSQEAGYQPDPTTGEMNPVPWKASQIQSKNIQSARDQQQLAPEDPLNVTARGVLRTQIGNNLDLQNQMRQMYAKMLGLPVTAPLVQKMDPNDMVPDNMTINDIQKLRGAGLDPVISKNAQAPFDMMKKMHDMAVADKNADSNQTRAAAAAAQAGTRQQQFKQGLNVNAADVGSTYDKDPTLQPLRVRQLGVQKALNTLHGNAPLLTEDLNAIQNEGVNALKAGNASTNMQLENELKNNLPLYIKDLKERALDVGDVRQVPEAQPIIHQIDTVMSQLNGEIKDQVNNQALVIHHNNMTNTNPQAQEINKRKLFDYAPEAYQGLYGQPPAQYSKGFKKGNASRGSGLIPVPPTKNTSLQDIQAEMRRRGIQQ